MSLPPSPGLYYGRSLVMDVTLPKKELLRLLSRMQSVAERKSSIPALSSVLITVEGADTLRFAATDMYLSLLGRTKAEVKKPGTVAVSAKDIFERVKMMPEAPVTLSLGANSQVLLQSKTSKRRFTLRGMPGEEFPPFPSAGEGSSKLEVPAALLRELIERTAFSISTDETRAHLNSALLEFQGKTLRMVTTDGHRLSKAEATVEAKNFACSMLIPQKAVLEVRSLCDELLATGEGEKHVFITQTGPNAFFQFGEIHFSVKLVEAQFPPYGQVIPASTDKKVLVNRLELAGALRAVSIAASERTGGVKVQINPGAMRITSESPEAGEGFDELVVDYDGPAVTIGFNAKYFLDVLGAVSDEEMALHLNGELDPAVLRPGKAVENKDYLAVVMPMRI
jgi:DNA polymerase III subunit beta